MEYEIKNDQYITSSTVKNANSIDAVEGTYYRKTEEETSTSIQIPSVPYVDVYWTNYTPTNGHIEEGIEIRELKGADVFHIWNNEAGDGVFYPLFRPCGFANLSITYGGNEFPVYKIEIRRIEEPLMGLSDQITKTALLQNTKGVRVSSTNGTSKIESESKYTEVENTTGIVLLDASWRNCIEIQITEKEDNVESVFNKIVGYLRTSFASNNSSTADMHSYFPLFSTKPNIIYRDGVEYIYVWAVCSIIAYDWSYTNGKPMVVTTTTSVKADDFGISPFMSVGGVYGRMPDDTVVKETSFSAIAINDADFSEKQSALEVYYDGYKTQSAKFTLSHKLNPKTKYTVPDTNLLTKVSYVQRYNEDGSLSSYKQPLFAEIADIILNNSKENKKTTTIEYIGTDNIQTGDTIFFAKDPSTKYIVTKTYLKANPFFVKTIYAREI